MSLLTAMTSPDPLAASFAVSILLATFLTVRCHTPPNPNPTTTKEIDNIGRLASPAFLFARRAFVSVVGIYHAILSLTYPSPPSVICPNPENLSSYLFSWTTHTIICVLLITVAASIRIMCFSELGTNFTFRLDTPKKLVTTGLYSWVQHPSYTTNMIVMFANGLLFQRRDGVLACWLPRWFVANEKLETAFTAGSYTLVAIAVYILSIRVRDEETMLRKTFGKEWEVYHAKTKRFIPYVF